jgi:hypothetical protein
MGEPVQEPVTAIDPRAGAEQVLFEAEAAFGRQQYPEAYGLAARALRVYLSCESMDGSEVTAAGILAAIPAGKYDHAAIGTILDKCADVAFAKGEPDDGEFTLLAAQIREIIRS